MKQFISNTAAAALAGILLLIAGYYFADWTNKGDRQVSYEIDSAASFLGSTELSAILKWVNSKETTVKIAIVKIENTGQKPLKNLRFTVRPTVNKNDKTLYGMGMANSFGGEMLDPVIEQDGFDFKLKVPGLKPRQGAFFWIAHQPPQGFELIDENEELEMTETNSFIREMYNDDSDWVDFTFLGVISILIGSIIGLFVANSLFKEMLEKAGYDPDEIEATYVQNQAQEKLEKKKGIKS